jgi:hypothetical protein
MVAHDDHLLMDTRKVMERFYNQIKLKYLELEFVFITGVTKFSTIGLNTLFNNYVDISFMPEFDAFMGFTEEELTNNFSYFFDNAPSLFNMSGSELLSKLRNFYKGFSFDGIKSLYNPFSINYFFLEQNFQSYWIHSGSDTTIRKFFHDNCLTADQFQDLDVDQNFAIYPGELNGRNPEGFLYQAGYLTLRSKCRGLYVLDYPNLEVRQSLSRQFLLNFNGSPSELDKAGRDLARHLAICNVPGTVDILLTLLFDIFAEYRAFFDIMDHAERLVGDCRKAEGTDPPEGYLDRLSAGFAERIRGHKGAFVNIMLGEKGDSFYRSVLCAALWMAGARPTSERHEDVDRLGIEVDFGGLTYFFKLKMTDDVAGGQVASSAWIKEMHDSGCGMTSENAVLVSLAIGRRERNIVVCIFEKEGQEMCLFPQGYWKYLEAHKEKAKVSVT